MLPEIDWQDSLHPLPHKNFGLKDGRVMSLATTGLAYWHIRREGDMMRFGKTQGGALDK